ncbi:hypothetical protein [Ferrimicrobium sp.]|uniref:hypothetical protein n=1 Tax=Ferrimicrobium sp. TaxID=2926050 RepID=UPI00262FAFB0|nr:hypothetical protein [Ferrimicrobium sp.]
MERIVVTGYQSETLPATSPPLPDGVIINVEGQPPVGPVFTLAPTAKAGTIGEGCDLVRVGLCETEPSRA